MIFKISVLINLVYYTTFFIFLKKAELKANKALRIFCKKQFDTKDHLFEKTCNRLQAKYESLQWCFVRYIILILIYIALLFIVFIIVVIAFFKFEIDSQIIINKVYIPFCVLAFVILVCSAIDLLITTRKRK